MIHSGSDPAALALREQAARRSVQRWLTVLAVALGFALALAWRYAEHEREAIIERARVESALVADSRTAAVEQWLDSQADALEGLAGNQALGLYLMTAVSGETPEIAAGQAGYLRNLLTASAVRSGYAVDRPAVTANVTPREAPGLALTDRSGRIVIASGGPLPPPGGLAAGNSGTHIDAAGLLDGRPALRIAIPVSPPMADEPTGYLYGVRWLDASLADLLVQPGDTQAGAQTYLVGRRSGKLIYLMAREGIAAGSPAAVDGAATAAMAGAVSFVRASGADGRPVFVTSRPIKRAGWALVRTVPAADVLAPANQRRTLLLGALGGGLTTLAALVLLAWRHNTAVRTAQALVQEAEARAYFEQLANVQPTGLAVVASGGNVSFANRTLIGWRKGADPSGQDADAAFGPVAGHVREAIREAAGAESSSVREGYGALVEGADPRHLMVRAAALPAPGETLVLAEDVTDLVEARQRRVATLEALVHTLMGLIDVRDPGSAHHSERVSRLAEQVGKVLNWTEDECATLETAGLLLNVGKLFAPRSLLTKTGPLSPSEREEVHTAMARAGELIGSVPFDGPVVPTLTEVHGPAAGRGRLARLLVLANAFVSMVSPRAHRQPLAALAALEELRRTASDDDRAFINALAHYLDNLGGRAEMDISA